MKKLGILVMLALVSVACKKQYKCVCTNDGFDAINVYEERFNKAEADKIKALCEIDSTCTFKRGN